MLAVSHISYVRSPLPPNKSGSLDILDKKIAETTDDKHKEPSLTFSTDE